MCSKCNELPSQSRLYALNYDTRQCIDLCAAGYTANYALDQPMCFKPCQIGEFNDIKNFEKCNKCSDFIKGCTACDQSNSGPVCTACESGLSLSADNTCTKCKAWEHEVSDPFGVISCKSCSEDLFPGCSRCKNNGLKGLECVSCGNLSPVTVYGKITNCSCPVTKFPQFNLLNYTATQCVNCDSYLLQENTTHCDKCSWDATGYTGCISCKAGWFVNQQGICTQETCRTKDDYGWCQECNTA